MLTHTHTHTHTYSHSHTLWGCGWRPSDQICFVCVCVCVLCVLCCALVVGQQQLCGDYFCFFFFFLFSFLGGFSLSDPSLRVWHFGDDTLWLKWHLICFSFWKISAVCPPQSISYVNLRWLVDTFSFNFTSMCLLMMLTMYEGSRMRECWIILECVRVSCELRRIATEHTEL